MPRGSQATKEALGRRDLLATEGQVWVAQAEEKAPARGSSTWTACVVTDRMPAGRARSIHTRGELVRQEGSVGMLPEDRREEAS